MESDRLVWASKEIILRKSAENFSYESIVVCLVSYLFDCFLRSFEPNLESFLLYSNLKSFFFLLTKQNHSYALKRSRFQNQKDNLKSPITMTDKVVSITNISDLCTVCLLKVFHYLDLTELANLAEANIGSDWKMRKQTNKIDRYKQSIVTAFKIKIRANEWKTFVHTDARHAVKDIKMLRSFGNEIESLLIDYDNCNENRRYEKALEDAVTKYCCKTLSAIDFVNCYQDSMNEIEPFTNVNLVEFRDAHVGSTLGQLKKWFPNMDCLQFTDTYVVDSKCIHEHFPQLESLIVWNGRKQEAKKEKMIFTNSDLKVFAILNPQLEKLHIRHDDVDESESGDNAIIVDWDLLTFISKNLLQLERLKLNLENFRFERKWQSTVSIDSLIGLDVNLYNCDCLDKINITSAKFEELNLIVDFCCRSKVQINYEAIARFVIRTKPKRLKIKIDYEAFTVDNIHVLNMIRMLPKLQEISIDCLWEDHTSDAVINLLVNSNALEKLVGVFNFDSNDKGYASPKFLQMRQVFREKIDRNNLARTWSYKFEEKADDCYYIDSVQFQKNSNAFTVGKH